MFPNSQFGGVVQDDLFQALTEQAVADGTFTNYTVKQVMDTWTLQSKTFSFAYHVLSMIIIQIKNCLARSLFSCLVYIVSSILCFRWISDCSREPN